MTQSMDTASGTQYDSQSPVPIVERRHLEVRTGYTGAERRQFASSHDELTPEGRELAEAIDRYKLAHRRRYITHDETLDVLRSLGYRR